MFMRCKSHALAAAHIHISVFGICMRMYKWNGNIDSLLNWKKTQLIANYIENSFFPSVLSYCMSLFHSILHVFPMSATQRLHHIDSLALIQQRQAPDSLGCRVRIRFSIYFSCVKKKCSIDRAKRLHEMI